MRDPRHLLSTLEQLLAIDALDRGAALDEAAGLINAVFGADKTDVWLKEPGVEALSVVGISDTPLSHRERELGLDRLPLANGGRVVGVFQTGETYCTGRADLDEAVLPGFRIGLGLRSMACAPIANGTERRGVLVVSSTQPDVFTTEDLDLVVAAARWVGMLVHRSELTERLRLHAVEDGRRVAAEELVSILAHDLRGYLSQIKSQVQAQQRRLERGEHDRCEQTARAVLASVTRQERLIADLLDATRLDRGLFSLSYRRVDLVQLAEEVAAGFSGRDDGDGSPAISVEAPFPEVCVEADEDRIRQALENLLANALRYAPRDSVVRLAISMEDREDGPWGTVVVADQGPGVAPDILPRLFDRFSKSAESGGLGLGLYVAHGAAQAHGGSLSVESAPGQGARFTLAIPAHPGVAEAARRGPAASAGPG